MGAKRWALRHRVKGYRGGVVIISHDVDLLADVVNKVFYLDAQRTCLDIYNLGWKAYLEQRETDARRRRRERMNAIRQHVLALPERQRMAVLMHKYEGMDYKQIGDVLKLSESATKSLLFRAYQTLREKLKAFV